MRRRPTSPAWLVPGADVEITLDPDGDRVSIRIGRTTHSVDSLSAVQLGMALTDAAAALAQARIKRGLQ